MKKKLLSLAFMTVLLVSVVIYSKDEINYFPEIAGWKLSPNIQTYAPDNLFAYINGAADLYINYDFEELKVAEYQGIKFKETILIEVYRHRKPVDAFGIYSQERPEEAAFFSIGTQGYYLEGIFNFFKGNYYVKISCFDIKNQEEQIFKDFAAKVASEIGSKESFPELIKCFPAEGKIKNSEKYISRNVLGYSFFHSGYQADYNIPGFKFTALILEAKNRDEAKQMISEYLKKNNSKEKIKGETIYSISDTYHGNVAIQWKDKYIWGIIGSKNSELSLKYVELIKEQLLKQQKLAGAS